MNVKPMLNTQENHSIDTSSKIPYHKLDKEPTSPNPIGNFTINNIEDQNYQPNYFTTEKQIPKILPRSHQNHHQTTLNLTNLTEKIHKVAEEMGEYLHELRNRDNIELSLPS